MRIEARPLCWPPVWSVTASEWFAVFVTRCRALSFSSYDYDSSSKGFQERLHLGFELGALLLRRIDVRDK